MGEEIYSKEEYFFKLKHWINQSKLLQNASACFPYYLASNYPNYFSIHVNGTNLVSKNTGLREEAIQADGGQSAPLPTEVPAEGAGYEFVLAPLWKRFLAEMVDVALLFLLKVAITFTLLNVFDLDLSYDSDSGYLKWSVTEDGSKFSNIADLLTLSSDLVALEIIMKVLVCLYEALWTMHGRIFVGGATPGKLLLRLRILHIEVLSLPNGEPVMSTQGRVLIYPAANPGFRRAFLRAVAKNLVFALLFPVCFVFLFLKNNRTFYDLLTKTVVVEENPSPILRRR